MISDYQTIMLPLLKTLGDEKVCKLRDLIDLLADKFELTEEERKKLLPSGSQAIFSNRVGWAKFYLLKAGLAISKTLPVVLPLRIPKRSLIHQKLPTKHLRMLTKIFARGEFHLKLRSFATYRK